MADILTPLESALLAYDNGLCVVPPREDGSKRPESLWKQYQDERPSRDTVEAWYRSGRTGIGIVCGRVSGYLEMLEFEGRARDLWKPFVAACHAAGLEELINRVVGGYAEFTPTGGVHLLYRCTAVEGNLKLARRPASPAELALNPDEKIQVLIETRGEGGYVIVAPSGGRVHPTGQSWELRSGGFDLIEAITADERAALLDIARSFNQIGADLPPEPRPPLPAVADEDRPGDNYNRQPGIAETTLGLLLRHGWTEDHRTNHEGHLDVHLRRPGKHDGSSAVLHMDAGTLYVFTTSSADFDSEDHYSPFAVLAVLEHAGDYKTAARSLLPPRERDRSAFDQFIINEPASLPTDEPTPTEHAAWQLPSPQVDDFLNEDDPEYDWIIPGLLERGDRVIVTAAEGMGKSTLIRQLVFQAASGIHPFTHDEFPPVTAVLLDLENSRRHVRRQMRPLRALATTLNPERVRVSVVPEGIDLMHDEGLMALDDLLARTEPDLVAVGPLYKLASGDPKDEEQAQAVRKALDHYRVKYGCALLIEAHQPYATGNSSKRPLRPYGASLWSRWPEFGIALSGQPGIDTAEIRHWRGARDERNWPAALTRGGAGNWPWIVAASKDLTFARMCEIAREHIATEGSLPSIRHVSDRLTELGIEGSSKTRVGEAIKANQRTWDALLLEVAV